MSFTWGNNIKLTIYGESHGKGVGIIIDGISSGNKLDYKQIKQELVRRKTKSIAGTTKRQEEDNFEIISGIFNGKTNGGPINVFFPNIDAKSKEYSEVKYKPRPSHADYPANIKYNGYNDYRGGGFFSARLTAPIVFAGAIAKSILKYENIKVYSHILKMGKSIHDLEFSEIKDFKRLDVLNSKNRFMINNNEEDKAQKLLQVLTSEGDSIGAKIECMAMNLPVGLGEPYFNSIESDLSSLVFSIPGVKAIEFGLGEKFSEKKGSEANDEYRMVNSQVLTTQNNNGGILGGITNGMPINLKVTFKPTSSISKPQKTVNLDNMVNTTIALSGRHDACIAIRGRVVVEAVVAIVLLNFIKLS